MNLVIDSSVVAKWVLPESDSMKAQLLVADSNANGDRLVVLDLVFAEVTNLTDLLSSPVHVEATIPLVARALEIAIKYDRAVYDALFVALSESLATEGITADEPLFNVVKVDFPLISLLRNR